MCWALHEVGVRQGRGHRSEQGRLVSFFLELCFSRGSQGKKHVINKMIAGGDKSCKKIKQADWGNEKRRTVYSVVRGNSRLN